MSLELPTLLETIIWHHNPRTVTYKFLYTLSREIEQYNLCQLFLWLICTNSWFLRTIWNKAISNLNNLISYDIHRCHNWSRKPACTNLSSSLIASDVCNYSHFTIYLVRWFAFHFTLHRLGICIPNNYNCYQANNNSRLFSYLPNAHAHYLVPGPNWGFRLVGQTPPFYHARQETPEQQLVLHVSTGTGTGWNRELPCT